MPRRSQQDLLGAEIWRANRRLGQSFTEIAKQHGWDGRNVPLGIANRQEQMLIEDDRDLSICAALDRGESPSSLSDRFEVPLKHVQELKQEIG